ALPPGGHRGAAGGRLPRRDDADGVPGGAGSADAFGSRGGGPVGAAVPGAPLPADRPGAGGVRGVTPGARGGGLSGVGGGQRAEGVPRRRLDGAGGGGDAAGSV